MSHYKPYLEYKDSGVEWIGAVPEHWELRKVAWDMKMTIGWTPPTGNRSYYGGPHNWVSISDLSAGRISETKQTLTDSAISEMHGSQAPAGSLLFSYKLSIGEVALLERPAYTNEAIAAFHPCKRVYMPFWRYAAPVILPHYSRKNIYGSDLLNQELMNSARMVIPNFNEQVVISEWIDRETARIDAIITKKTRFIELLKEKRSALITHAVTKGTSPNVNMKDSGVEWIGAVPEHWIVMQFKRTASICNGQDYKDIENKDGAYPVIGSGGEFARASSFIFNGESVLLGRKGTIDKPLYINGPFWTVDTMFYTKIAADAFPKFVYYSALNIPFGLYSTNTALPSMTGESLSSHLIAAPKFTEQRDIANSLDRETARIDLLTQKTQHSIDLLKERRSALITAAVTGQIDLRESA